MNAVKERNECSLARLETRMESRVVEDIRDNWAPVIASFSSLPRGARTINLGINNRHIPAKPGPPTMPSSSSRSPSHIPITVFTGFLGAGKTSIILSLLPQLPSDYRVVLLKNEFGDIEGFTPTYPYPSPLLIVIFTPVDSQLAKQSSLMAVSEILNGCMLESFSS